MLNPQSTRLLRITREYPEFVKSLLIQGLIRDNEIIEETEHYFLNPGYSEEEEQQIKTIILETKQSTLN